MYCFNDLLLQVSNQTFQIDSLVIADKIYVYEIKNYQGDFYYDNDRLYNRSNFEISNPLTN
ncbi:nuclease-related domain-containing protein [Ornithinibacillus scapharcae]|uniref:nuclease-related domain-containing protein n=1 Tax=Ornithinibacillus scapharcae TaxID=1147159 RepID=UPI00110FA3E2